MTLTPEQHKEAVEAMAMAISGAPFPSKASYRKAAAALSAALPVIERAVLERAAAACDTVYDGARYAAWQYATACRDCQDAIRALASEVKT